MSVLIPVYNAERYLEEAINSILNQTLSDFEVIIVDDGSTDASLSILNSFAQRDSRIHIISRPNTGIVGALNDGLKMCSGKYIARMDADDLCRMDRFELQVQRMEAEPEIVALGSCATIIDPEGDVLGAAQLPLEHEQIDAQHLKGVSSIFHPAVMIRRDVICQLNGYRKLAWPAEDMDLWLRLAEKGKVANLPEQLFIWRRTLDGIVASSQASQRKAIYWILNDCWQRRRLTLPLPELNMTPLSQADLLRQFGWLALKSGSFLVARKYAWRSVIKESYNIESWRLVFCVLRGY
jgi:glycosyltransferase involved in cell wall biosynthesis